MASTPLPESDIPIVSDDTVVVFDINIPNNDDFDTEIDTDNTSEFNDVKSIDSENRSVSGESANNTLLTPDIHSYMSESDTSPIMYRKKRPAPQPPNMSPTLAARHTYAFDMNALKMRTSTDTESITSESRLFYQTSTDSESLAIPESARGSNFPGELAGVDNLYSIQTLGPSSEDNSQTPRPLSRLGRLREVFRSPQIGRRKTMKEEKGSGEHTPRIIRKAKTGDGGNTPAAKKSKVDEGKKLAKVKETRLFDPIPPMSNWITAAGYEDIDTDQEFEVKRVLDYEKFLTELLEETDNYHVDYVDISRSLIRVRSMMKEREEEVCNEDDALMEAVELRSSQGDLSTDNSAHGRRDSINTHDNSVNSNSINTSNNNNNNNEEQDTLTGRKLSTRRRSAPSALLFKSLASMKMRSPTSVWHNTGLGKKDQDVISQFKMAVGDTDRAYVTESSVQLAAGMQIQDRYLFLFSDLLLITKQKSNTTFKLKQKVHLCDMWIASCIDDVSDITRPVDRSFVIGWPTTNVVATFPNVDIKDDWLSKFSQNITKQKIKEEHKSLQLKVIPKDIEMVACSSCQVTIDVFTQAKDVVLDCLKQANISDSEGKDYQLWVMSGKDNSPYPLIGHETPYSIKFNQARDLSRSRSANDLDNMTAADLDTAVENISGSANKCEFYLKQKQSPGKNHFDSPHHKPMKKHKKTPKIFNTIFRKKRVFGLPLAKICDKNLDPPESIIKLMVLVYQYGPHTSGILRRGNNTVLSKDIKEKINSGDKYNLEDHMAPTAASVFKEFLRNIPDGLLVSSLHEQWLSVKKDDPHEEKINKIKTILAKLPPENYHMLKLTICLLQHLAKHSSVNMMGPSNLATCIAPSLYVHGANGSPQGKSKGGDVQKQMQDSVSEIQNVIAPLISFLITYHIELFGEDILTMFVKYGCQASPATSLDDKYDSQMQPSADEEEEEEEMIGDEDDDDDNFSAELTDQHLGEQARPRKAAVMRDSNSGTDSDSMHSVLSLQDGGMGLQRDDSSIDSLGDRDFYSHGSPKVSKSHLSPSNLSRDSGLTLSDNQLYDEESYQADIASASAKIFQAKMSNPDQPDVDSYDYDSCRHSNCQTDKNCSPVPPPRKRSMRRKAYNVSCDGERRGFVEYVSQRPPLKHSISTTYLDESPSSAVHKDQRHILQLQSSPDKIGLSDSDGKDQEATDQLQPIQKICARTNVGTLVKSESGSHLYLNEETLPSKFPLEPLEAAEEPTFRHNSLSLSRQSRHSQSSCDSVISDSIYSTSRDGSINSAPLTPEEPSDMALNWIPDINLPGKPWMNMLLHGATTAQSQTHSKSADLHSRNEITSENPSVDISQTLNSPKLRLRKSHEAEEVHTSNKPHFSLTNESQMDFSTISSNPFSKTSSRSNIHYGKQSFSAYLDLGSPPPNVILQTLQNPAFKEHAPVIATGAHLRHSAVDLAAYRHFHFSKAMQSIRHEEYLQVRSMPVIISPEDESSIATAAAVKAKLSKYIKDTDPVLSLSKQHVDKPFKYHQVPRNSMTKYNEPDDITEKQKEDSARAKAMYEKSLQLYQKEKPLNNQSQNTQSNPNLVVTSDLAYAKRFQPGLQLEDTKTGRPANCDYMDTTLTNDRLQDSFHSAVMSDDLDDSGASGFLDIGSISLSLERDIDGGHKPRAESVASSFNRSISPGNLLSISRNESRLSDTDSSGSSTVTVSTLSQSSDSFNQHSDLSNITVSSVTSSDSNSEAHSVLANRRSASNSHQNRSPRNSSAAEIDIDMMENEDDVDVYPGGLKKDPKELYFQSMQIYEQKSPRGISTSASQGISSSVIPKVSSASQGVSSSASHGLSSSAAHKVSPSTSPQIKKALISHPLSNVPKLQSSPIVPISSSQKAAAMTPALAGRPAESKTRLSLDAPSVNLHRSCSDLANHVHKQGSYSSHSTRAGSNVSADAKENNQSTPSPHNTKGTQLKSQPKDVKSEYQQNFLRAKSCFHQAEGIRSSLSDSAACHSGQSLQHSPPAQEGKPRRRSVSTLSVTAEPPSAKPPIAKPAANSPAAKPPAANSPAAKPPAANSPAAKPPAANSPAAKPPAANSPAAKPPTANSPAANPSALPASYIPHSQTTDSTSQVNKKEFPWSVKVLKSNFDTDKPKDPGNSYGSRNSNESTSQTPSHSCPQSPTSFRNPSSLRHQDSPQHSRSSSSSSEQVSSSQNTSPRTSVSYRQGPQDYSCEVSHYSYSSSDDSYSSSPDKRTTWLSGTSFNSEELADYTNTTYI